MLKKFQNLYRDLKMDIVKLSTDWAKAEVFSAHL